jgi:hypothetical protein
MKCPNCHSYNVHVQVVNEVKLKDKHHGIFWWLLVGWYWVPLKWLFLTVPAIIAKIFGHKKQKAVNKTVTYCVCEDCGHKWRI